MEYKIENNSGVTIDWGNIPIINGGAYVISVTDIQNQNAILTFEQYASISNLVKGDKVDIYENNNQLGPPADIDFMTKYYNNPYDTIGVGDMLKSIYDSDNNDIVDNSELFDGYNLDYFTTSGEFDVHINDTYIHFPMSAIDGLTPPGGSIGYVLKKITNADYEYDWFEDSGGGSTSGGIPDAPDFNTYLRTSGAWVISDEFDASVYYTSSVIETKLDDKEDSLGLGTSGQVLATNSATNGKEWIDLPNPGGRVDSIIGGIGIDVDNYDPVNPIVSISATDITNLSTHSSTELNDIDDAGSGEIITSVERNKLNNIEDGAEVNVQSDWNITDTNDDAFILNKPTIITDHGNLTGLDDDDHPQYHNDTRGDTRYYQKSEVDDALDLKEDDLGLPLSNGQLLSSNTDGSRLWVDAPSLDLSTHSVTELNDVTDAGSGEIITDAERTKLLNAMDRIANTTQYDFVNFSDTNGGIADLGIHLSDTGTSSSTLWSAENINNELDLKEDDLGSPSSNGQVLSSDTNGSRSWTTIPSAPVNSVFGRTGVVTAQNGDYTASQITNTPAGNISSTNVQYAINELDTNKLDSVTSDSTLSGDGTSGDPLSVDIVIDDLNDVDTTTNTPTNDQILQWDGSNWIPANLPAQTTPTLDDVTSQGSSSSNVMSYTGTPVFNNDLDIPDKKYVDDKVAPLAGDSSNRPSGTVDAGTMYFATDLGYPIWFDSNNNYWVNASGSYVLPGI